MKTLPHIVINAHAGEDSDEARQGKFENHIIQRRILRKLLPDIKILSCTCTYDNQMKRKMKEEEFEAVHLKVKTPKWKKINFYLTELYKEKDKTKSILFLDDDTIPYIPSKHTDTAYKNLYKNTIPKLKQILHKPQTVPAPCCFFHIHGLKHFMYTKDILNNYSEDEDYETCSFNPVGKACFIKANLNILYEEKDVINPRYGYSHYTEDFPLRAKCVIFNKPVAINHHVAFEELRKSKSTVFKTQERRIDTLRVLRELWAERYPNHFFFIEGRFRTILYCSRLGHQIKSKGGIDILLLTNNYSVEELHRITKIDINQIRAHLYHVKTKHKDFKIEFEKGKYRIAPVVQKY